MAQDVLGLPPSPFDRRRANRRTMVMMAVVGLAMLALGFASVPLYRIFCEKTGYGGTPQRAYDNAGVKVATGHRLSVRFDSNVAPGMPWQFRPEQATQTITIGAKTMAIFIAKNMSNKPVTGSAAFNVSPEQAGAFFTKIQCFCFTQQTLQPGQEVRMPVIYYVDPKILQDADNKDTQEITLSYTFYPVEQGGKPS
jgi:cytochrome c oxidase assembly protein subunit 11